MTGWVSDECNVQSMICLCLYFKGRITGTIRWPLNILGTSSFCDCTDQSTDSLNCIWILTLQSHLDEKNKINGQQDHVKRPALVSRHWWILVDAQKKRKGTSVLKEKTDNDGPQSPRRVPCCFQLVVQQVFPQLSPVSTVYWSLKDALRETFFFSTFI